MVDIIGLLFLLFYVGVILLSIVFLIVKIGERLIERRQEKEKKDEINKY